MRNSLLLPVLFLLMMGQQAKAALVFSVASGSLVAGATSFDAEIRVSGGALDSLQYFAIETSASTLSGGKTLNIASQSTLNSLTLRNSADYVLFDRGQSVTGAGSATFVSNVGTSSAEFRDGVSVPNILGPGGAILNSPVVPGSGRLVAKLQFTLASGTFEAGDSFSINLAKLASNTNQFSGFGGGQSFAFTGAATDYTGAGTGVDLNNTLVLTPGVFSINAVPEPSSLLLIGIAASGVGIRSVRRFRRNRVTA